MTTTPSVEGDRLEALDRLRRKAGDGTRPDARVTVSRNDLRVLIAALPCKGGEAEPLVALGRGLADDLAVGHWSMGDAIQMIRGLCDKLEAATPTTEPDTGRGLRVALERIAHGRFGTLDPLGDGGTYIFDGSEYRKCREIALAALSDTPRGREISEVETHRADAVAPASKGGGE